VGPYDPKLPTALPSIRCLQSPEFLAVVRAWDVIKRIGRGFGEGQATITLATIGLRPAFRRTRGALSRALTWLARTGSHEAASWPLTEYGSLPTNRIPLWRGQPCRPGAKSLAAPGPLAYTTALIDARMTYRIRFTGPRPERIGRIRVTSLASPSRAPWRDPS
jgi:hypothetical protein